MLDGSLAAADVGGAGLAYDAEGRAMSMGILEEEDDDAAGAGAGVGAGGAGDAVAGGIGDANSCEGCIIGVGIGVCV